MDSTELAFDEALVIDRSVAAMLAARVTTLDGAQLRLREAARGHPTVIAFVRQFGCLFCHELVSSVIDVSQRIHAGGGRVVLVGSGTVEQARRFAHAKQLERTGIVLTTDPSRGAFDAAELLRGYRVTFLHRGARRAYVRAERKGFSIDGIAGDVAQQGGVFVIDAGGHLVYAHRSRFAGDHPDLDEVVERVTALA
jgi:peroxiredoxin